MKKIIFSRSCATAVSLCLIAGSAAAGGICARPQEITALRAAAMRQQLMVAALTCREAPSFNRFITSYQDAYLESDHTLLAFFERSGRGDDGYNAYKTRLANDASLTSLHNPAFCREAARVFRIALAGNPPLSSLVADDGPLLHTGYRGCSLQDGMEYAQAETAAPSVPARHPAMTDRSAPTPTPVSAPSTGPSVPAAHQGISNVPPPAANTPPPNQRDADAATPDQDDRVAENDPPAPAYAPQTYPPVTARPYAYPGYPGGWYGYQPPMRQVMGPDGRWYLMPAPWAR